MQGVSVYVFNRSVQVAPVMSALESYSGPSQVNRKQYAFDELVVEFVVWHSTSGAFSSSSNSTSSSSHGYRRRNRCRMAEGLGTRFHFGLNHGERDLPGATTRENTRITELEII